MYILDILMEQNIDYVTPQLLNESTINLMC